jgi:hypothetical protein
MRKGIIVSATAADRARLEAVVANRNSPQKHVWRARIVLLSADGVGTVEIMRRTGKSKTCMQRHRHQEFTRFLDALEREVPAGKIVHAILDNYGAHKHPKVRAWLNRNPRFVFHYTPTSCSWLNAVEGFLAKLTRQRLKRGVFRSIVDLQAASCGKPTSTPNPSPGPPIPTKSSPPSGAGTEPLASRLSAGH